MKYIIILNLVLILFIIITLLYYIYIKIKNRYIKELFTDNNNNKYIITMSSIPANFDTLLPKTIDNILNFDKIEKVEKIIVNIPKKYSFRFNNQIIEDNKINNFIEKYKDNNKIYLNIVDNDYGPGTKLIGSLEKNLINLNDDNLYTIILDDDVIYSKDLINIIEYNDKINDNLIFGTGWNYLIDDIKIGQAADAFYIKNYFLKNFINYFNDIKNEDYVLYHDDVYISYYFYLNNIDLIKLNNKGRVYKYYNENEKNNKDESLNRIQGKYSRSELNKNVMPILHKNQLNKSLEIYNFDKKIRLGDNSDGGYVIADLDGLYDCYISCGISNEASFDRDFLKKYINIGKNNAYAFDGTIKDYPWQYTTDIQFIKKNISNINDDNNTNLDYLINNYNNIFLAINIEGGEYPWILSLNQNDLNKFKQICIEFHGLNDNSWGTQLKDKIKCLKKLSNTYYLIHAHGNNHSGNQNNIPNVLELTYVNKSYFKEIPSKNKTPFPIKDLDYPNKKSKNDYILDKYPFVENFENFNWLFNISKYENKITSQGKQDGVIKYIIDNI